PSFVLFFSRPFLFASARRRTNTPNPYRHWAWPPITLRHGSRSIHPLRRISPPSPPHDTTPWFILVKRSLGRRKTGISLRSRYCTDAGGQWSSDYGMRTLPLSLRTP
ncbi:unnamed protein product, partial [Ectocarpus sp. 12 AP-2014]